MKDATHAEVVSSRRRVLAAVGAMFLCLALVLLVVFAVGMTGG